MPVYLDETSVVPLLTRMKLPRHILLDMATKIGGERANVAPHEPDNVVGFETWRWGTRFFRESKELKQLGWVLCDNDQVAGIRNREARIKLVCCGTNENTGNPEKSPRNLSERGANSIKLIGMNARQIEMFSESEVRDSLWYYCTHFCENHIAIEVSRPTIQVSGYVTEFSHRLIVAQPGEIPGIRRFSVPEEFADVPKPQVSRKLG